MAHVKRCLNTGEPSSKAKYHVQSIVNQYREGKYMKLDGQQARRVRLNRMIRYLLYNGPSSCSIGYFRRLCRKPSAVCVGNRLIYYRKGKEKSSLKQGVPSNRTDPKPGELPMSRLRFRLHRKGGPKGCLLQ